MIFGASTRAAAQSAVRAGFRPFCADHFADEDLYELADVLPLSRYPQGLVAAASDDSDIRRVGQGRLGRGPTTSQNTGTVGQRPPTADSAHSTLRIPWMYTGALENHPRLIKKLGRASAAVRQPGRCGDSRAGSVCRRSGFHQRRPSRASAVRRESAASTRRPVVDQAATQRGRARHSGLGQSAQAPPAGRRDPCYFQQRARGEPHSALYLATSAETVLIGVSRQLIGESRFTAGPFAYCGSIGPVNLDEALQRQIVRVRRDHWVRIPAAGSVWRSTSSWTNDTVAWLTEVNPRYTASVEVFESGPRHFAFERPCAGIGRIRRLGPLARDCGRAARPVGRSPPVIRGPKVREGSDLCAVYPSGSRPD